MRNGSRPRNGPAVSAAGEQALGQAVDQGRLAGAGIAHQHQQPLLAQGLEYRPAVVTLAAGHHAGEVPGLVLLRCGLGRWLHHVQGHEHVLQGRLEVLRLEQVQRQPVALLGQQAEVAVEPGAVFLFRFRAGGLYRGDVSPAPGALRVVEPVMEVGFEALGKVRCGGEALVPERRVALLQAFTEGLHLGHLLRRLQHCRRILRHERRVRLFAEEPLDLRPVMFFAEFNGEIELLFGAGLGLAGRRAEALAHQAHHQGQMALVPLQGLAVDDLLGAADPDVGMVLVIDNTEFQAPVVGAVLVVALEESPHRLTLLHHVTRGGKEYVVGVRRFGRKVHGSFPSVRSGKFYHSAPVPWGNSEGCRTALARSPTCTSDHSKKPDIRSRGVG